MIVLSTEVRTDGKAEPRDTNMHAGGRRGYHAHSSPLSVALTAACHASAANAHERSDRHFALLVCG